MRQASKDYFVDRMPLLAPDQGVEISENDLDSSDSGRDESGIMHRIVVRESVKTWSFKYAVLSAEDYQYIKDLFVGKASFVFSYRQPDGTLQDVEAYCSKRSVAQFDNATGFYKNMKFNIIEC